MLPVLNKAVERDSIPVKKERDDTKIDFMEFLVKGIYYTVFLDVMRITFFVNLQTLNLVMIKYRFLLLIIVLSIQSNAQLLNEIGISVGGSNYSGDIGRETYIYPNEFSGGIIYRRNLTDRIVARGTIGIYQLTDDDAYAKNVVRQERGFSFKNTLSEFSLGIEFNYWDYDIVVPEMSHTPYLFIGISGFGQSIQLNTPSTTYEHQSYNLSFPIALGYKYALSRNFSISGELRAQYAFADDLEFVPNSITGLSKANAKTNDWYFFTGVHLTYSFGRPPCAVPPRY
jgi:hypothetical protein